MGSHQPSRDVEGSLPGRPAPTTRPFVATFLLAIVSIATGCANETAQFSGVCLGVPYPGGETALCGELFNDDGPTVCNAHDGCEWTDCDGSCNFCRGDYRGCRWAQTTDECTAEPGCSWFAQPQCPTWEECVILWLQTGGCEELAMNDPSLAGYYGGHDPATAPLVTFADHCP